MVDVLRYTPEKSGKAVVLIAIFYTFFSNYFVESLLFATGVGILAGAIVYVVVFTSKYLYLNVRDFLIALVT